ncbi:MAG: alpha/beta hydrolase [Verrucomicrobiales bacterium]|nr:alpha/beta hydrolase [Verrucomicrobiales bacterium]
MTKPAPDDSPDLNTRRTAKGCALKCLKAFGVILLVIALLVAGGWWYFNPAVERIDGVVYGARNGRDLTFDVVQPADPNGLGVILLVSGSWKSSPDSFDLWMAAPLLRQGFTVVAVSHLSQPKASVQEVFRDVERAVRFIKLHADEYGIDPNRLGVTGGSSGGHLSLMLVTQGSPGDPDAATELEQQSSEVAAAAIFFPVTNLADLGASTENLGDGGPPKSYRKAFGPDALDLEKWKPIAHHLSPVYHVRADQAPVLIFHGDADTLTPLEQSEWFVEAAEQAGADVELIVRKNGRHGWLTMPLDIRRMAAWFQETL